MNNCENYTDKNFPDFGLFFSWKSEDTWYHIFNIIGFALFFASSLKSVYDLIVSEIYYRDIPLTKMSWCKLFHLLLPLSQITFCFSCIGYFMYWYAIPCQPIVLEFLTAGGGYILALCFLINSIHWAFLTAQTVNRRFRWSIIGSILLFFILIPIVLEIIIGIFHWKKDEDQQIRVHKIELLYIVIQNASVIGSVIICWYILHRKLKEFSGLHTINKLKTRLKVQMLLYIIFFFIRAICLLLVGFITEPLIAHASIFFCSAVFGDVPLAFVMLHFLQRKKPSSSSSSSSSSFASSSSFPSSSSSAAGFAGGGSGGSGGSQYQYAAIGPNRGIEDNSPQLNGKIDPTNDLYYPETSIYYSEHSQVPGYLDTTPYHFSPQTGHDTSTNSYYSSDGGGEGYV